MKQVEKRHSPAKKGKNTKKSGGKFGVNSRFGKSDRPSKEGTGSKKGSVPKKPRAVNPKGDRLNKVLAAAGVASRRKADELIEQGVVKVNGHVVIELGTRVLPSDEVTVSGRPVRSTRQRRYVLLNKPRDTISTASDERGRKTVVDLVRSPERLYPVGRLDRNTTGLLLLTNDGELANKMMHPRFGIERVYRARLDKPITPAHAKSIASGVNIGRGQRSSPCRVSVRTDNAADVELVITEGKNREVRRMFEKYGYDVKRLDRVSYAGLSTKGLARGAWRDLIPNEVRDLMIHLGLKSGSKRRER